MGPCGFQMAAEPNFAHQQSPATATIHTPTPVLAAPDLPDYLPGRVTSSWLKGRAAEISRLALPTTKASGDGAIHESSVCFY